MRAFVIEAPGRGVVRAVPVPRPGASQVVVGVERAGSSTPTTSGAPKVHVVP